MSSPTGLWLVPHSRHISRRSAQLGPDWRVLSFRSALAGIRVDRVVIEDSGYVKVELTPARFAELTDELRKRLGQNPDNLILA